MAQYHSLVDGSS